MNTFVWEWNAGLVCLIYKIQKPKGYKAIVINEKEVKKV
jgi:hypothetical protein